MTKYQALMVTVLYGNATDGGQLALSPLKKNIDSECQTMGCYQRRGAKEDEMELFIWYSGCTYETECSG
jgi:hypothetical protein